MLFHTPEFAVFLAVLVAILAIVRGDRARKLVLTGASYLFYMWWNPIFVLPLLATTAIDYQVAGMLEHEERPRRRRALLVFSLVANLGLLAYFKYFNFFVDNASALARSMGFDFSPSLAQVILPVGISFYTFHTMSYTIDVYRREIPVCRSPLRFALFITFFPVLVAGPILRAKQFLPELGKRVRLTLTPEIVLLVMRGLAKKVLVADNIGPFADAIFADPGRWPSAVVWIATLAFAVQIYCDFSGYSDIARGLARIFGYEIPLNFDRPYAALNPSDFWRRWHISLSTWLRDYLYIPLGGNRDGSWRTYRNLMITMLLGGLWHGASWNFVLWGCLHGAMLAGHRLWRERTAPGTSKAGAVVAWAATQYCVLLTWIAFRVTDTEKMAVAMRKFILFDFDFALFNLGLAEKGFGLTLVVLAAFLSVHAWSWRFGDLDRRLARLPLGAAAAVCVVLAALFVIFWPLAEKPFIYFQF
jgi:alginate O-acetyltransferase complex protein AlgI